MKAHAIVSIVSMVALFVMLIWLDRFFEREEVAGACTCKGTSEPWSRHSGCVLDNRS